MGWHGSCNVCFAWQGPWRNSQDAALRDAAAHASKAHPGRKHSTSAVPARR